MPPQDCIDKGCHDRMTKLEEAMHDINRPEDGALARLHEKANGKVSFPLFIWIVAASFAFTSIAAASLYTSRKELFENQDKRIDEINNAQDRLVQYMIHRLDKQEETLAMLANALAEHRAFTGEQMAALKKKVNHSEATPSHVPKPDIQRPAEILKGKEDQ